ncbi:MAG: chromosome partitioning protein, partial [Actinomycetota bacterium]|nr:chromosome partitioning protein [Actinomycetota bacterium]
MTLGPRPGRRAVTGLGWPDPALSAPGAHPSGLGWPEDRADNGAAAAVGQPAPVGGPGGPGAGADPADVETSSVTPSVPGVSRETPGDTDDHEHQEMRSALPPPVVAVVSRETPFALSPDVPIAEDYSIVDVVSRETDDTPIARAAETAVRVLSGRLGEPLPPPPHTRVLTVANQKGGVGKTTTTVNLAAALALQGAHVLVIDLDPQGNASTALGVDHHSDVPSVYDVVVEGRELSEVIAPVEGLEGLFCAPATIDLAGAEIELVSLVARESRLRRALDSYAEWCSRSDAARLDYVLIDCPPSLGLLTVNALVAAPEVLIPIQCEYYALEGVSQLLRNIEMVKA